MRLDGIHPGDIAHVEHLGRTGYLLVTEIRDGKVHGEPINRFGWRTVSARDVKKVWPDLQARARAARQATCPSPIDGQLELVS